MPQKSLKLNKLYSRMTNQQDPCNMTGHFHKKRRYTKRENKVYLKSKADRAKSNKNEQQDIEELKKQNPESKKVRKSLV